MPANRSCLSKQIKAGCEAGVPVSRAGPAQSQAPVPCIPQVFGFFATIVFAVDFYLIFNEVAKFLKQGSSADETTANKAEGGWPRYGSHWGTQLITWDCCCRALLSLGDTWLV